MRFLILLGRTIGVLVALCVAHLSYPDRRQRDADNLAPTIKALIDGLVHPHPTVRGLAARRQRRPPQRPRQATHRGRHAGATDHPTHVHGRKTVMGVTERNTT